MSVPPILFVSGRLWSTIPVGVQGMVPVPCFHFVRCFLRSPLVPSEWESPVGWLQSVLACQSKKSGKKLPMSPRSETRGQSRKQHFGPGLPIGESARRRPAPEASAPVGEVGRRSCRAGVRSFGGPFGWRPVCPPGPLFLDFLGRPMSYRLFSWAEPGRRCRSPRDPRFMNPTLSLSLSLNL